MRLSVLLAAEEKIPSRFSDYEVGKPCIDSRHLQKNDVFFWENGTFYIKEALEKGASAVVTDGEISELPADFPVFRVKNIRKSYASAWQAYTEHPERAFRFFAVTGTNGKTSVAHFLSEIFRRAGYTVGTIGTIENFDGHTGHPSEYTTPPPEILYPLLVKMKKNGVTHVVMEASSHAIIQERLHGIPLETAIFTNLTRDHLDYHQTEEAYRNAKAKLFETARYSLLQINDPAARHMAWHSSGEVFYYGQHPSAEYFTEHPCCTEEGISYLLHGREEPQVFSFPLSGSFHIENTAAALACAHLSGMDFKTLAKTAKSLTAPQGRLEKLNTNTPYHVYIDYAHTPDALEKALTALRPLTKQLTVIFGAGGNRDRGKRAEMGAIADRLADRIILTNDNPRTEEPIAILADIQKGIQHTETIGISNRKQAIEHALSTAKEGEILLLAGKGHENYIIDHMGKHPFSERAIVYEFTERKGPHYVQKHP